MNTLFEQYMNLDIDAVWIGLEERDHPLYSCTPIGARIFGWDCGGLHYCFIDSFGEMVFAVNPENFGGPYVYPLARNFSDFLSMLLTYKTTNALHQIIIFEKEKFLSFFKTYYSPASGPPPDSSPSSSSFFFGFFALNSSLGAPSNIFAISSCL